MHFNDSFLHERSRQWTYQALRIICKLCTVNESKTLPASIILSVCAITELSFISFHSYYIPLLSRKVSLCLNLHKSYRFKVFFNASVVRDFVYSSSFRSIMYLEVAYSGVTSWTTASSWLKRRPEEQAMIKGQRLGENSETLSLSGRNCREAPRSSREARGWQTRETW